MTAPTRLTASRARVLAAVIAQPHPTIRSVMDASGLGYGTARYHLDALRLMGLIAWESHRKGTLRALVEYVEVAP